MAHADYIPDMMIIYVTYNYIQLHTYYIRITDGLHTDYIQIRYEIHADYIQNITYILHTYNLHWHMIIYALHIKKKLGLPS
jgi:hypothetical protein